MVDVREPDEVIKGSIPSSVNMPLSSLANSLHLNRVAFKEKFGFDKPQSQQEVVFYCRSGKRSASASDLARRNGYTKCAMVPQSSFGVSLILVHSVYNYAGSWLDWVEKEGSKGSS